MKFDPIWESVIDLLNNSRQNIFLTGKAWSWKSTLLRHFLNYTSKRAIVLAPTGVAALNVGWQTIHSFFWFPPTITIEHAIELARATTKWDLYRQVQLIVIDEISMVRADLLDCIDIFLQEVNKIPEAFGGVQMVFIGDLYQLPPVVTYKEKEIFTKIYRSPYFFSSKVINSKFFHLNIIELQKIYRQNDDVFIEVLNRIRSGLATNEDINIINSQVSEKEIKLERWLLYLCGTNEKVTEVNQQMLDKIGEEEEIFPATVQWSFNDKDYPTNQALTLKVGAQVMFVVNDIQGRRHNGSLGKVTKIGDYSLSVKLFDQDEEVLVEYHTWEVNRYFYDKESQKISTEVVWSFKQLPLKLAWALTIHKSQWKTFDRVVIDFEKWIFSHWQVYVALSRCTSLKGLILSKPLKLSQIIVDPKVTDFLTRYPKRKVSQQKLFDS